MNSHAEKGPPRDRGAACLLGIVLLAALGCTAQQDLTTPAPVVSAEVPPPEPSRAPPAPTDPAPPATAEDAGAPASTTTTLFVHEQLGDCLGETPMKCLRVRETADGPWQLHYAGIDGFKHVPGQRYELRVEVTKIPDAPADASSLRYRLLEIVSQGPAPKP